MTSELVKEVTYFGTYFGEFGYLNSSCIRKSIILMFLSSSRDEFTLLWQNSVTDVSVGFRPPCRWPSGWAPAWRLHTIRKIAVTWNLAKFFAYLPSFFSQNLDFIYWTVLIFILIYFEWRDTENHQFDSAILKRGTGNRGMGMGGNGERGTGNGESLKWGIFKSGNL